MQRSSVAPNDSDAVQGHTTLHEQVSKYDPSSFQGMRSSLYADVPPILTNLHRQVNRGGEDES
jgi:hypothetical protein